MKTCRKKHLVRSGTTKATTKVPRWKTTTFVIQVTYVVPVRRGKKQPPTETWTWLSRSRSRRRR